MSKPCENCGCGLKVCKDCDLYTGKYFKTELQAKLEKIKEDFEEIKGPRDNPYNNKTEYSVSMKELREVFDKHIAELKGE